MRCLNCQAVHTDAEIEMEDGCCPSCGSIMFDDPDIEKDVEYDDDGIFNDTVFDDKDDEDLSDYDFSDIEYDDMDFDDLDDGDLEFDDEEEDC